MSAAIPKRRYFPPLLQYGLAWSIRQPNLNFTMRPSGCTKAKEQKVISTKVTPQHDLPNCSSLPLSKMFIRESCLPWGRSRAACRSQLRRTETRPSRSASAPRTCPTLAPPARGRGRVRSPGVSRRGSKRCPERKQRRRRQRRRGQVVRTHELDRLCGEGTFHKR